MAPVSTKVNTKRHFSIKNLEMVSIPYQFYFSSLKAETNLARKKLMPAYLSVMLMSLINIRQEVIHTQHVSFMAFKFCYIKIS